MKPGEKKTKGVTLIELIIAMAIVAVIVAASAVSLVTGIKAYGVNVKDTLGQQNLRSAMMDISKQVRNPSNIITVTGSSTLTVNGKSYTVTSGSLYCNGRLIAQNIASVNANYTDTTHKVIQIDLASTDGNTLSTQISLN